MRAEAEGGQCALEADGAVYTTTESATTSSRRAESGVQETEATIGPRHESWYQDAPPGPASRCVSRRPVRSTSGHQEPLWPDQEVETRPGAASRARSPTSEKNKGPACSSSLKRVAHPAAVEESPAGEDHISAGLQMYTRSGDRSFHR